MNMEERRIVVVGNVGNGKSATANSILGRRAFTSKPSNKIVTTKCQFEEEICEGKRLIIVDTPGLFNVDMPENESLWEMAKVIGITSPGLHALIVVVKVGRFTEQEIKLFTMVATIFGSQIYERIIILFTGIDDLDADGWAFGDYVNYHIPPELKKLVKKCGYRTIGFNNRADGDIRARQVHDLLEKIDTIVAKNKTPFYIDKNYTTATRMVEAIEMKRGNGKCDKRKDIMQREIRKAIEGEEYSVAACLQDLTGELITQCSEHMCESHLSDDEYLYEEPRGERRPTPWYHITCIIL